MLKPRRLLLIISTLIFITFANNALAQTEIKNPLKRAINPLFQTTGKF